MIRAIHQIEITSRCNLRCRYCAHPNMKRDKVDMNLDTFMRSLMWAEKCVKNGTQQELNLAGIGESTMHPDFKQYVYMAREVVGDDCVLALATNGLLVDEALADWLAKYDVHTWVSLHRPEVAAEAVTLLNERGILYGVSTDPVTGAVDWAGQVDWHVSAPKGGPCFWTQDERVFVMADGSVAQCCFDAENISKVGSIWDAGLLSFETEPYSLCEKCHLDAGSSVTETMKDTVYG